MKIKKTKLFCFIFPRIIRLLWWSFESPDKEIFKPYFKKMFQSSKTSEVPENRAKKHSLWKLLFLTKLKSIKVIFF
jgi:hypothetical protein